MVSVCRPVCLSRHRRGMCLMQDGATSHIARRLLPFCKLMPWPSKSPDLNPIKRNWDAIGRGFRRRGLANVRRFAFLMDGWNGITQRILNVWGTCMWH